MCHPVTSFFGTNVLFCGLTHPLNPSPVPALSNRSSDHSSVVFHYVQRAADAFIPEQRAVMKVGNGGLRHH